MSFDWDEDIDIFYEDDKDGLMRLIAWEFLEGKQVDALNRKIVTNQNERLTLRQCAEKMIDAQAADFGLTVAMAEQKILSWLELDECFPDGMSAAQLEEFEEQIEQWIKDYEQEPKR